MNGMPARMSVETNIDSPPAMTLDLTPARRVLAEATLAASTTDDTDNVPLGSVPRSNGYAADNDDDDNDPDGDHTFDEYRDPGIKLSRTAPYADEDDENGADPSSWVIQPDWFKFWISLMMFVFTLVTFGVLSLALVQGGLFCGDPPSPAVMSRLGAMYSYQNTSAPVCSAFYDYACGSYDARFVDSSPFSETQNQIVTSLVADGVFNVTIDRSLPSSVDFNETGLFECIDVEVLPDYTDHTVYAVYISPYCATCPPQVHHVMPAQITDPPIVFPDSVKSFIVQALTESRNVYWLTPESGATAQVWYEQECDRSVASSAARWAGIAATSTGQLVLDYYGESVDGRYTANALPNQNLVDFVALVEATRLNVMAYIDVATWLTTTASRTMLKERVAALPVHVGGPTSRDSGCALSQSLYDCLRFGFSTTKNRIVAAVNPNSTSAWPFDRFTVNAAYFPQIGAIYVPWGIAQKPFYDPLWIGSDGPILKTATLGAVIAHEFGHTIDDTPWNNIPYSGNDVTAIRAVKDCIALRYRASGSIRTDRTESENWADYIGVQSTLRTLRLHPTPQIKTGLIVWTQMMCSTGTPRANVYNSTDPHSEPFLRANATLSMLAPWYSAFECLHHEETDGPLCG